MFLKIAKKIFGSANERFLKQLEKEIHNINNLEKQFEKLSDNELKNKTKEFKNRLKKKETLESIFVSKTSGERKVLVYSDQNQLPKFERISLYRVCPLPLLKTHASILLMFCLGSPSNFFYSILLF